MIVYKIARYEDVDGPWGYEVGHKMERVTPLDRMPEPYRRAWCTNPWGHAVKEGVCLFCGWIKP